MSGKIVRQYALFNRLKIKGKIVSYSIGMSIDKGRTVKKTYSIHKRREE